VRILGSGDFVATLLPDAPVPAELPSRIPIETLAACVATRLGVPGSVLLGDTQTWAAVAARQLLAYLWVEVLGRRASALARAWGQTRGNVTWAAQRGAIQAVRWQTEIPDWCR